MGLYRQARPDEFPQKAVLLTRDQFQLLAAKPQLHKKAAEQVPTNVAATFDDVVANTAAIWMRFRNGAPKQVQT